MPKHLVEQGIAELQRRYPNATVVRGPESSDWWTIFDLDVGDFAIWNYTGNVYRVDEHGATEDDPFIEVTKL
jgi:hypothetical protein